MADDITAAAPIGSVHAVVFDCADAESLLLEGSDKPIGWRVYADPAGHPFCLTTN